MANYTGTGGDDTQVGGSGGDYFDYSQGGHDTLTGGAGGGDTYFFGGAFDSLDEVIGSDGWVDQVLLDGDYSAGVTIDGSNFYSVDQLWLSNFSGGKVYLGEGVGNGISVYADGGLVDGSAVTTNSLNLVATSTVNNTWLIGGDATDYFSFSGAPSRHVRMDGGAGQDILYLGQSFHAADRSIANIEIIYVTGTLNLVLRDANLAAGQTLTVATSGGVMNFDGHRESDGHYVIYGGNGADAMIGGHLGDTLTGGADADTLQGGGGADQLTGGDDADVFRFQNVLDSTHRAHDTITDLENTDFIDVSGIDADTVLAGKQDFVLVSAFSGHAGELVVSYSAKLGATTVKGDVDGDGHADLYILISGDHSDFTNFVL